MPTTIHRWCIWHIMKKTPRKLNGYKGHNKIEQEMSHVFWNSYTKEAFDRNWIDFLRKYGLGGNKWLSELTGILHRAFDKVMAEMEEYQERSKGKILLTHEEETLSNVNDLQNPPRVKTRGRSKNRLGSNLEKKRSQMP
ncbi:hypothetical protein Ahy_A04g019401 [Arachis hypogaea]|uniref:Uncharacterized protein n=1 Tax=Arachis hypogaea TaxID=3818 RepID=A0A445DFW3_ARAHY|nr:hypothetical protein Ahy_A04g019401 [Arachis hypogaea]